MLSQCLTQEFSSCKRFLFLFLEIYFFRNISIISPEKIFFQKDIWENRVIEQMLWEMSSADNQDYCQPGLGVTGGGKKYPTCFAK